MKAFPFCLVCCLSLLSLACVRPADFDLDVDSRMGITCFIAPHMTEVEVRISESQTPGTVMGTRPEDFVIADAVVLLHNLTRDQSLPVPYDPDTSFYRVMAPPDFLRSGDAYRLEVQHPRLPDAEGRCEIPAPPMGFEVAIDSVLVPGEFFDRWTFFAATQWQDFPGESNYYRLVGKKRDFRLDGFETFVFWQGLEDNPDYVQDDEAVNGQIIGPVADLQAVSQEYATLSGSSFSIVPQDSFLVDLLHITEDYHRFQLDLRYARNSDFAIAEPYFIHSNLDGAEGVFAAYAQVSQRLRIR